MTAAVVAPLTGWRLGLKMVLGGMAGAVRPGNQQHDRCCGASRGGGGPYLSRVESVCLFIAALGLVAAVIAPTASAVVSVDGNVYKIANL